MAHYAPPVMGSPTAEASQMQIMQVTCPPGCAPGSMVSVTAPTGQQVQVAVPQGVGPGMPFQVQVPAAAPVAVAHAQQPQMMMQQQPQMMMQPQQMGMQPQMMQGNSYHMLAAYGDLFIKQQIEMLEAFTGFETENKYDIFAQGGAQHVFHAMEQSDCCTRQCCGPNREFTMTVFGVQGPSNPIITIKRPFRCRSPFCCNLQEVSVYAGAESGQLLGVIREQWSCGASQLDLEVGGKVEFKIEGPLCVCDGGCCGDQVSLCLSTSVTNLSLTVSLSLSLSHWLRRFSTSTMLPVSRSRHRPAGQRSERWVRRTSVQWFSSSLRKRITSVQPSR